MARVDRAERLIDAPADRLYAAWTDAHLLARWLAPAGAHARVDRLEPWPDGVLRITLRFSEPAGGTGKTSGDTDVIDGRFVALDPGRRIVQRFRFDSADPAFGGEMTMTWCFEPRGAATLVSVAASGVPAGIAPADHEAGMASSLANLAACFESDARR